MMRGVKALPLVIASIAVLAAGLTSAAVQGSTTSAPPTSLAPSSVAFWDKDHGLIGASSPGCGGPPCPGTIAVTEDGGVTTRVLLHTDGRVMWLSVAPHGDAWAIVVKAKVCTSRGCPGQLLRSTDWGASWQDIGPPNLEQVTFGDAAHGLGTRLVGAGTPGSRTQLVASGDGGRTWHATTNPCAASHELGDVRSVSLVTRSRGWALCVNLYGVGNAGKSVFRTGDGGAHWRRLLNVQLTDSAHQSHSGGIGLYGYPEGIAFAPNGVGLLWESRGTLYLTWNAGRSWNPLRKVSQPELDFGASASVVPGRAFALLGRNEAGAFITRLVATRRNYAGWQEVRSWKVPLR
jgi:photosystem II stability/assembly factor-like uncharacterized protein